MRETATDDRRTGPTGFDEDVPVYSDEPSDEEPEAATPAENSGFVWPAAEDDVDPDVSPTVKAGEYNDEESRLGPAALVTGEDRSGTELAEIQDGIDLATSEEIPVVRIVEQQGSDGEPPDPRTLTASLAATGTSITDAL